MENKSPEWLNDLLNPANYDADAAEIKLIQTHLSWVFLAGKYVYKVKKPVDFGFLDFTSLEKRRFYCQEEIRLNKRLCPEIYIDVVPITLEESGSYRPEGNGRPVEWAVKMKRMPDDGIMTGLIEQEEVYSKDIEQIAEILCPFYKGAKASEDKLYLGGLDVIRGNCMENFDQTGSFIDKAISKEDFEAIKDYTVKFMEDNRQLFLSRQENGWIVEGHGDLYSANICLDRAKDKIYIFDCIEFNERFRYGDVAVDVAFLSMDLDFMGLCHYSSRFIDKFQATMSDPELTTLLDFYKCYRAYVRGKIGCFTWASPEVDQETRNRSLEQAKRYFKLALRYTGVKAVSPTLYVFMGLSGTGKSTIAKAFAQKMGIPLFNSDYVRKEIIGGIPADSRRLEPFGKGIYSPEFTKKTYKALARFAGRELILGNSVVLDATYIQREKRELLRQVARASGARLVLIHCSCPDEMAFSRMAHRLAEGTSVSDGRKQIYLEQKKRLEPPQPQEADVLIELDTSPSPEELLQELEGKLS